VSEKYGTKCLLTMFLNSCRDGVLQQCNGLKTEKITAISSMQCTESYRRKKAITQIHPCIYREARKCSKG